MVTWFLTKHAWTFQRGQSSLLNKRCWGSWISTRKRLKLDTYLTLSTKISPKWIKNLNVKPKTIKLLEENIGHINIRNIQTCREFLRVYLSQTEDCCWEEKPPWTEEMPQRTAVLHPASRVTIKEEVKVGYMNSVGDRFGRWKKAKRGNFWD